MHTHNTSYNVNIKVYQLSVGEKNKKTPKEIRLSLFASDSG